MTENTKRKKFQPFIPRTGKVASVLTERELAINIGKNSGVEIGMKFKVLTEKPTEIIDPDSKTLLGKVDREKIRVEVIEVQPKLSVCRTYKTYVVGGMGLLGTSTFNSMFSHRREITETLKAEDSAFPQPLSEEDSFVKKGDRVQQIIDE